MRGAYGEAVKALGKATELSSDDTEVWACLGYTYAMAGNRAEAQRVLATLNAASEQRGVYAYDEAILHAGLGEKELGFAELEKAYEDHADLLRTLKFYPVWDSLRSDLRFQDLLRRVGFTP